jgi:hypothetical protein
MNFKLNQKIFLFVEILDQQKNFKTLLSGKAIKIPTVCLN